MTQTKAIKKSFPVLEMSCASCAVSIENVLKNQTGVVSAMVNFASATVVLDYFPDRVSLLELQKVVQSIGFGLLIDDDEKNQNNLVERIVLEKLEKLKLKTLLAGALTLPLVIIGMLFMDIAYANYIMLALATPVVLYIGKDFYINAWKQAQHGSANMDTLVALSTGVAYIISVFSTFFSGFWLKNGLHSHVYFEAAAVVITLILLGKLLEEKAKNNTSTALKKLMSLEAKTVFVIKEDGESIEKKIENVSIGNLILVKPGEKIPVDGKVLKGESFVDESRLTGEPIAVFKNANAQLYAGSVNQKGSLVLIAEQVGNQTLLASIIQLIQEAQNSKSPVQKWVDKIAAIFVPIVILIALITFFLWWILGKDHSLLQALWAMVTVLVIACPCALGLATPTAIMVGIGKGAQQGILIKDVESLESAKKINALVLDKTGTITEGKPTLTNIQWKKETSVLKSVLLAMEQQSEHPLAQAVVGYFEEKTAVEISQFQSLTGRGVKAVFEKKNYYIGNENLMLEYGIYLDEHLQKEAKKWTNEGKTVIYFFDEKQLHTVIAITDKIKPTSQKAIIELQNLGIEVFMLTGDHFQTAKIIAHEMGITHFKAQALPQDKVNFVKNLQNQGKIVAMVGDGINDSAAMAQADVSIAMGKGSDIAMDVAKMTLISSDLSKLPIAIQLSKATSITIRQNIFWAFIYNIIAIPIAAGILYPINGFLLNPMAAAAAMALSSLSVVSNSLRLKYRKF